MTASSPAPARGRPERLWLPILLAVVFATAIGMTLARHPAGVTVTSDPGYAPVPVPLLLAPAVLTSALVLLLPRGKGQRAVRERRPGRLRAETAGLVAIAASFPLLVPMLPLPEDYVLLKFAMFLVLPCLVLGLLARRGGASIALSRPVVAWWIPLLPALMLGITASVGPSSPGLPSQWPGLAQLVTSASATAITAGLGEEVLYRRLLQPRLEVMLGGTTALLLTSLLFGLMHVFSHGSGPLWADALQVIAVQGTTGIALGLIWGRWHRLWPCVLAHVLLNGFAVLLHLLGVLG